jgi:3-oxoacyl-[acyl-carrier-protein] synthase-3
VTSEEIDRLTGMPEGWTRARTGIVERRQARDETASQMGAIALRGALAVVGDKQPLPAILIAASGTPQQPIPCNASLIAKEMGWEGVTCFDVNATCLGFVVALHVAAGLLALNPRQRIAIVCSEIASKGLNWREPESAGLMGDGAAAMVVEHAQVGQGEWLGAVFETWPEGVKLTEIRGGGTALHATKHVKGENSEDYLFHMDGPAVFRLAAAKIEPFVSRLIGTGQERWTGIDWVVPHQASLPALQHVRRRLGIPPEKFVEQIKYRGNVIAASIPLTLHECIVSGQLRRGQKVMLLGSSAGFSLGAALLRY